MENGAWHHFGAISYFAIFFIGYRSQNNTPHICKGLFSLFPQIPQIFFIPYLYNFPAYGIVVESGEKGRKMLSGGFVNTLDEKGRVTCPSKLINLFSGDSLWLTNGLDHCLWAFPPEAWDEFAQKLEKLPVMKSNARAVQRNFLGWAVQAELDKSGRLAIPQALREKAGLKKSCVMLGLGKRIEIWDEDAYNAATGCSGADGKDISALAEDFADLF
jgi:MraZ protein